MKEEKFAVLALSGGMDSSSLLLNLLGNSYQVTALSFDYGQKHKMELERANSLVEYLRSKGLSVVHRVIELKGLAQLLNSSLVEGGEEIPEGHYEDSNMKDTVVPNRNKIFSSIIQAVALSISQKSGGNRVEIGMGIHGGDHEIYPDCRKEFRDADYEAFLQGNWGADKVSLYTPYLSCDKTGVLKDGSAWCSLLSLDFNEVYSRTNTSYKPIKIKNKWYSDYKSASSVERVESFIKLNLIDPIGYADESGPVDWNTVVERVSLVLEK